MTTARAPHADSPPGPLRTCVGCRRREPVAALLRVVALDGVLTPDPRRQLPGRGAWLHPVTGCLDAAERRRVFGQALRLLPAPGKGALGDATPGNPGINAARINAALDSTLVRIFLHSFLRVPEQGQGVEPHPAGPPENTESRSTRREHAVKFQK